jgi:CheY-like chemotaxis protein
MDRVLLSRLLQDAGHEPIFAPNGRSAIRVFERSPADLVVTDLSMPEMDGLELIEALREDDPWLRIIAVSGFGETKLAQAKAAGAVAVLAKPVDPGALLEAIEKALDGLDFFKDVQL